MFNVVRSPFESTKTENNSVTKELRKIFYGKCYLCESDVYLPEKEHFVAKSNDKTKEKDWNNLYYVCRRCNLIKYNLIDKHKLQILDCCDSSIDVSNAIKCICASIPNSDFPVEAQLQDKVTENTANLLYQCYNANDGDYEISREKLHDKIFGYFYKFLGYKMTLENEDSLQSAKENAKEHLKIMLQDSYPFSIFWKWHIKSDKVLSAIFP